LQPPLSHEPRSSRQLLISIADAWSRNDRQSLCDREWFMKSRKCFLLCIAWLASAVLAGCDTGTMGEQPSVLGAPSGDASGTVGDANDGNTNVSNDSGDNAIANNDGGGGGSQSDGGHDGNFIGRSRTWQPLS
jgi:hypothetical protein